MTNVSALAKGNLLGSLFAVIVATLVGCRGKSINDSSFIHEGTPTEQLSSTRGESAATPMGFDIPKGATVLKSTDSYLVASELDREVFNPKERAEFRVFIAPKAGVKIDQKKGVSLSLRSQDLGLKRSLLSNEEATAISEWGAEFLVEVGTAHAEDGHSKVSCEAHFTLCAQGKCETKEETFELALVANRPKHH